MFMLTDPASRGPSPNIYKYLDSLVNVLDFSWRG